VSNTPKFDSKLLRNTDLFIQAQVWDGDKAEEASTAKLELKPAKKKYPLLVLSETSRRAMTEVGGMLAIGGTYVYCATEKAVEYVADMRRQPIGLSVNTHRLHAYSTLERALEDILSVRPYNSSHEAYNAVLHIRTISDVDTKHGHLMTAIVVTSMLDRVFVQHCAAELLVDPLRTICIVQCRDVPPLLTWATKQALLPWRTWLNEDESFMRNLDDALKVVFNVS
jgi:hypothetical protein